MSEKEETQITKNAAFAAKEAADQPVSREQYAKDELGIEIPVDTIPLPSNGKVYPTTHPFYGKRSVDFRSMTVREEDILTSAALIKKGTVINELIKACLMNKDVDPTTLLAGDRNALMIAIRASGYGTDYNPTFSCPSCKTQNTLEINLGELGIKGLELEPSTPGSNAFDFELPHSKATITFKFLTGQDEEAIMEEMKARKKRGFQVSNLVSLRLRTSILAINGITDRSKISRFSENMPARDSSKLRSYIDQHEPGVDMMVGFECTECEHEEEVALPMDASFFWPNSK